MLNYANAMGEAAQISRSTVGDQSQAYRDKDSKLLLVEHVASRAWPSTMGPYRCRRVACYSTVWWSARHAAAESSGADARLARQMEASQIASPSVDLTGGSGSAVGGDGGASSGPPVAGKLNSKDKREALELIRSPHDPEVRKPLLVSCWCSSRFPLSWTLELAVVCYCCRSQQIILYWGNYCRMNIPRTRQQRAVTCWYKRVSYTHRSYM